MRFRFFGKIIGKTQRNFEIEIEGASKKHCEDILYSLLGSRYKVKRSKIIITKAEEIK